MTDPLDDDLLLHAQSVAAQSREQWDRLQHAHAAMQAVSETARSPEGEVVVTAVMGGVVSTVDFPTDAHRRLTGHELAVLVRSTIAEAQQKVTAAVAAILESTSPEVGADGGEGDSTTAATTP